MQLLGLDGKLWIRGEWEKQALPAAQQSLHFLQQHLQRNQTRHFDQICAVSKNPKQWWRPSLDSFMMVVFSLVVLKHKKLPPLHTLRRPSRLLRPSHHFSFSETELTAFCSAWMLSISSTSQLTRCCTGEKTALMMTIHVNDANVSLPTTFQVPA